jgi:hypothetical protein
MKKMGKSSNKYHCEHCDYISSIQHNYKKHLLTLKHKIATNDAFLEIVGNQKNEKSMYYCNVCDFQCNNKSNYEMHLLTKKHRNKINGEDTELKYICSHCNKEYSNNSGLWKHKKICVNNTCETSQEELKNTFTPNNNITSELVMDLIKQNKEFQTVLVEQNKELQNKLLELASNQTIVNNNNTTNNNQFNLNFYLNETCKDAMNIVDFINSMKLTIDDFETTGRLGFVDGISRIFIKELKKIETEKLPIHCTDLKRETVYIKDNNTWEKENDEKKRLKWAIDSIGQLNFNLIQQWQEKFPECRENNTRENEKFFELAQVALGGRGKEQEDKFRDKIMKNVLKEVVLDKQNKVLK